LRQSLATEAAAPSHCPWLAYVPVDVSIPLLLRAGAAGRGALDEAARRAGTGQATVVPVCADFEDGPLSFVQTLPTTLRPPEHGLRLVMMLGNVFGNLRDEGRFVRYKLQELVRPGDLAWLEVGLRMDRDADDPLYEMTGEDPDATAASTNRRLLLEGPFRRWECALGRHPSDLTVRVWLRHDDD
ncbi:MAG: L-histidine N(alpha)-methyltransferase, partial [Myxococcales bacterium]|nr:L-histidine N(alpha)-methyltransferase [Myxococcales bacterium]